MELWIRSQDKMALAKFDLLILEGTPYSEDKYMFIADHYKNMGVYKTKERALEVLDEIQNILKPKIMMKYNDDFTMSVSSIEQQPTTYVYEMPEE